MNILVTGSNGQLGTEIGKIAACDETHQWFFTDVDTLDICDETALKQYFDAHQIEVCINCAAYTAVDKAEDEPLLAEKINADAPALLAAVCRDDKALLVHISTDYVFNGQGNSPYREDDVPNPVSVYGRTKLDGEQRIRESQCNHIIIRTAWLYSATGKNFVKTMLGLADTKDNINVVSDQQGTPTWAFDLAEMIVHLVNRNGLKPIRETFHFTNDGITTWYDFAKASIEIAGKTCRVNAITTDQYPTKAHRPAYSVLDKSKIKAYTNRNIPFWRDSLIKCIDELQRKAAHQS